LRERGDPEAHGYGREGHRAGRPEMGPAHPLPIVLNFGEGGEEYAGGRARHVDHGHLDEVERARVEPEGRDPEDLADEELVDVPAPVPERPGGDPVGAEAYEVSERGDRPL